MTQLEGYITYVVLETKVLHNHNYYQTEGNIPYRCTISFPGSCRCSAWNINNAESEYNI